MGKGLGLEWEGFGSLAAAETEDEVERRLFLDVVVRQRASVLQLLASNMDS